MGSWSYEPFGNDAAGDWSDAFVETTDLSMIEVALDKILVTADDDIDEDSEAEAVAAIEVLAKLLGKGTQTDGYTEYVDQWVHDHPQRPDDALLQKAANVIERMLSEETLLMEQRKEDDEWRQTMNHLLMVVSS